VRCVTLLLVPGVDAQISSGWPGMESALRPSAEMRELPEAPAPFARPRRFERGELLIRAGEPADALYLIWTGYARVFRLRGSGREITTSILGPGQPLGIAVVLRRPAFRSFAEALTAVEAWRLPAGPLLEYLPRDGALLDLLTRALGRRLGLASALLREVTLRPVVERVPDVLPRLEAHLGGERPPLTHELLASLVGARRETVSRALAPRRDRAGVRARAGSL
jgi:CRP-like cAMP-binding protein